MRQADVTRQTLETRIRVALNLDGSGVASLRSGIGFLDHMLEQIARHGLIDLTVECEGDLHIDGHHTVEDIGITIGGEMTSVDVPVTRWASSPTCTTCEGRGRVDHARLAP